MAHLCVNCVLAERTKRISFTIHEDAWVQLKDGLRGIAGDQDAAIARHCIYLLMGQQGFCPPGAYSPLTDPAHVAELMGERTGHGIKDR